MEMLIVLKWSSMMADELGVLLGEDIDSRLLRRDWLGESGPARICNVPRREELFGELLGDRKWEEEGPAVAAGEPGKPGIEPMMFFMIELFLASASGIDIFNMS